MNEHVLTEPAGKRRLFFFPRNRWTTASLRRCRRAAVALTLLSWPLPATDAQAGAGIGALRAMLQDKNPEIRIRAAEGLARVGGREAVFILRQGLSDRSIQVRTEAVKALGFVGGRLAITVISEALKDNNVEVRKRALEALVRAGTISSLPVIQKAFGDKEESVRLHAALMLRKIGHRMSVGPLGRVLATDKSPAVRAAAAEYLGKVGVKNPRSVAFLAKGVEDKEALVRIKAVESLGFIQLRQAIPLIEKALQDKDSGVRIRATEVLGHALAKDFE